LVDTRAAGGYVVAAGSIVDGRQYEIVNDIDPAPLPAWLAALLADPTPEPRNLRGLLSTLSAHNPSQYAGAALRGEVQRVLDATEGTRNDTLNRAAFALGQLVAAGVLPEQLAYDCLHAAALHTELPAREAAATIRSGLRSGARKPRMEVAA
ncbi:MAG: bifunctional DNA primase/polymerase, partial [Streptosporangiaceae bacterium]